MNLKVGDIFRQVYKAVSQMPRDPALVRAAISAGCPVITNDDGALMLCRLRPWWERLGGPMIKGDDGGSA